MKIAVVGRANDPLTVRLAELLVNAKVGEVVRIPEDVAVAMERRIADATAPAILEIRRRERQGWAALRNMRVD